MTKLANAFAAALLFAFLVGAPWGEGAAFAQIDLSGPTDEKEIVDPEPVIDATATDPSDAVIRNRLTEIFSQIPALQTTKIEVVFGVVTLSGIVESNDDIARAEDIAARVVPRQRL